MTYPCLQGWNPSEFPQLRTLCHTSVVRLAGDAIPKTMQQDMFVTLLCNYKLPRPTKIERLALQEANTSGKTLETVLGHMLFEEICEAVGAEEVD